VANSEWRVANSEWIPYQFAIRYSLFAIRKDRAMIAQAPAADPDIIRDYHAHVYYDPVATRERAERLRARVAAAFPQATLGRWHDELVGPHTQAMFQIAFPRDMLAAFLPWLMLNRDGLAILLHPETGNDVADHSGHAAWLGAMLPLRLEVLRG
jgi:aromatic ring-cleaving dioxygenase